MTCYVLNEEKMFSDISDGIAIVINSETGIYYGMNELGTVIFENLINGVSVEKIAEKLKSFADAPSDIENKLNSFINELLDKNLIIASNIDGINDVNLNQESVSGGFDLSVSEYDDAQELLLADPIHEVREDTGWTGEKNSIGYSKEETKEREGKIQE